MLHLGPVVVGDAWRNGRVRHKLVDAGHPQDVRRVVLQSLVVPHHAVVYFARRAQLCVSHPVDNVFAELPVHSPAALGVSEITDKVLKSQTRDGEVAVAVDLAVFANDGRGYVVLVPRLEAGVLHELVLECRNEAFKGISHNEELKVRV